MISVILWWFVASVVLEVIDYFGFSERRVIPRLSVREERRWVAVQKFISTVTHLEGLGSVTVALDRWGEDARNASMQACRHLPADLRFGVGELRFGFTYALYVAGHELAHLRYSRKHRGKSLFWIKGNWAQKLREYNADMFGVFYVARYVSTWKPGQIAIAAFVAQLGQCGKGIFGVLLSDHPEDLARVAMILGFELIAWMGKKLGKKER